MKERFGNWVKVAPYFALIMLLLRSFVELHIARTDRGNVSPPLLTPSSFSSEWSTGDGVQKSRAELVEILESHSKWLVSGGKLGKEANLRNATIRGLDLGGIQLQRAELGGIDLSRSRLDRANLSEAHFVRSPLPPTRLRITQGVWTVPAEAGPIGPPSANLREASMVLADLSNAVMTGVDLTGANLSGIVLGQAKLQSAKLDYADLQGAKLSEADLSDASLTHANLRGAELTGASFYRTDLGAVVFEPKSLPSLPDISLAKNLSRITFDQNSNALTDLRKLFRDGGYRRQEREITYALKKRETIGIGLECLYLPGGYLSCLEYAFSYLFFDWTCRYGMSPGRPLVFAGVLWFLCSIAYLAIIHNGFESGLQLIPLGENPSMVRPRPLGSRRGKSYALSLIQRESELLGMAALFSLMSGFSIGFRDFNFGRWLRFLTREEFDFRATDWARVVSGWQSLLTVYFIALWLLTYFGRPFE